MRNNDELIRTEDLEKTYHSDSVETPALRGVALRIAHREFAAVAGPSGSGKSTLLNLLGGLDRPSRGEIFLEGMAMSRLSRDELARLRLERIGFVFQDYNLIPVLTVIENAAFVLELRGVDHKTRTQQAGAILSELGIEKYARQFPNRLSGGEQQRVAIARAVAAAPAVVLADEPTANLDTEASLGLIDLMRQLNEHKEATFLFATHDSRLLDRVRRVITLVDGRVTADTTQ